MGEVNVTEIKTLNGYPLADTKARAGIATLTEEIANKKGLTSAQITALDNMFKVCAYTSSAETAYAAFCAAFGITGGGTGGDSGEGSDEVNVYFADYSEWPIWGPGISVVENGFTVTSDKQSSGKGIAVGILHPGKYNDYKEKTLAISMDVAENFEAGGIYPAYLATYSDVPETSYVENQTASKSINQVKDGNHVRYTVDLSSVEWDNTPNDNDYLAFRFYCYFVGTATFTNFSVEVV